MYSRLEKCPGRLTVYNKPLTALIVDPHTHLLSSLVLVCFTFRQGPNCLLTYRGIHGNYSRTDTIGWVQQVMGHITVCRNEGVTDDHINKGIKLLDYTLTHVDILDSAISSGAV